MFLYLLFEYNIVGYVNIYLIATGNSAKNNKQEWKRASKRKRERKNRNWIEWGEGKIYNNFVLNYSIHTHEQIKKS